MSEKELKDRIVKANFKLSGQLVTLDNGEANIEVAKSCADLIIAELMTRITRNQKQLLCDLLDEFKEHVNRLEYAYNEAKEQNMKIRDILGMGDLYDE